MGNLKPGVTYVYERDGEAVYARESGSTDRQLIGWHYNGKYDSRTGDGRSLHDHLRDRQLWVDILREARTNTALQQALERVILLYKLSKEKL